MWRADPGRFAPRPVAVFNSSRSRDPQFLLTVKGNKKTLHRQIRSQFLGKRHIPCVASDRASRALPSAAGIHALPDAITSRERRPNALTKPTKPFGPQDPTPREVRLAEPPHPWQYLTASLGADDPGGAGMDLSTETLAADPQAPSGWRTQRLDQRHYRCKSPMIVRA